MDKQKLLIRKTFGIALSGLKENAGFTSDISLDFDDVPEGYEKMRPGDCFLTGDLDAIETISSIAVPAGSSQKAFYVNITKSAIEKNSGKKVAVKVKVDHVSGYAMNAAKQSAYVLLNTADFGSLKIEITDQYF